MTIISICGLYHGVGTTHTAISIATALKARGYKVCVAELNPSKDILSLGQELGILETEEDGDYFSYKGIDYILYRERFVISSLRKENYGFVIADYGTEMSDAFLGADFPLVVTSARKWKRSKEEFYEACELLEETLTADGVTFIIPFATDSDKKEFKSVNSHYSYIYPSFESDPINESSIDVSFLGLDNEREKASLLGSIVNTAENVANKRKIESLEKHLSEKEATLSETRSALSQKESEAEQIRATLQEKETTLSNEIKAQEEELAKKREQLLAMERAVEEHKGKLSTLQEEKEREIEEKERQMKELAEKKAREIEKLNEEKAREIEELEQEKEKQDKALREREEALKKEKYAATHDTLTKCKNRAGFDEDMVSKNDFNLIFFDVNYLKKFNDNLGHEAGDKLLLDITREIRNDFPNLYRMGGDEFCAISDMALDDINIALEKLDETLTEISPSEDYPYSVAFGVAESREGTLEEVLHIADERMYENKKSKRTLSAEEEAMREAQEQVRIAEEKLKELGEIQKEIENQSEELKEAESKIEERKAAVEEAIKEENDPECIPFTTKENDTVKETDTLKYLTTMHFAVERVALITKRGELINTTFYVFPTKYEKPVASTSNIVVCETVDGYEVKYNNIDEMENTVEFDVNGIPITISARFVKNNDSLTVNILTPNDVQIGERISNVNRGMFTPNNFGKIFNNKEYFPIKMNINGTCDSVEFYDGEVNIVNGTIDNQYKIFLSDKVYEIRED